MVNTRKGHSKCVVKAMIRPGTTRRMVFLWLTGMLFSLILTCPAAVGSKERIQLGLLMANDTRQDTVDGFKAGMDSYADHGPYEFVYTVLNAKNQKERLPAMASEIIAQKPDIAIAAGGIEADALMAATKHTQIPVVFLSVSSVIDRGLASSMTSPDKNFTGVETNDTRITAKRLWFIKRFLPEARTVCCFHVPTNVPSVESVKIARNKAMDLGLRLIVKEINTVEDIRQVTETAFLDQVDVILLNPVAVILGALQNGILPKAMALKIPVFGNGMSSIKKGAFASYAGSRYENGRQAARLAHKIAHGEMPKDIPIETPEHYELIINKWMVNRLGLELADHVYKMADKIVDIKF